MALSGLDLFSGYGGISFALKKYITPIAYCEIDPFARKILLSRMSEGKLFVAPIWDDIKTLSKKNLQHKIDIIYGGFPCQDISVAGNGKGLAGERSILFYEVARLAEEIKPKFIFLENVPAIRTRGLREIGNELAEHGYDCRWCVISARDVGAPHLRKRWFLLAKHSDTFGKRQSKRAGQNLQSEKQKTIRQNSCDLCDESTVSNSLRTRLSKERAIKQTTGVARNNLQDVFSKKWWAIEPDMGRVANGVANRVDRIKALGNGVVPLQVLTAFEYLLGCHNSKGP